MYVSRKKKVLGAILFIVPIVFLIWITAVREPELLIVYPFVIAISLGGYFTYKGQKA